ncbi:MAG: Gfo/Idh/MocA family oxidoreductase [Armatimonadetes bacterium]|nr:Gfo/Idh/MocA family oxidoreductase [Armatimonadota bacterium]
MAIGWGVIGCGGIADRRTIPEGIIPASGAELVAVQDAVEERTAEVAEKYGVKSYATVEELLADDAVQAVYIATPTHVHHEQTVAAAQAGKHVLCEKPLALTLEECEASIAACEEAGVKFGTNFMMRFHACHVKIKELVDSGALGTPVLGRAELTCWYPPIEGAFRQIPELGGGGALIDMGNHCIDLLEFFFGKVVQVTCFTGNVVQDYQSEDTAVVALQFQCGAVGMVDTLFNEPDAAARNMLEVYGSRGSLVTKGTIGQDSSGRISAILESDDKEYDAAQVREGADPEEIIEPEVVNMYEAAIQGFCEAIENDTEPPITGEDGLWSHKVIDACYESARTGRAVALD